MNSIKHYLILLIIFLNIPSCAKMDVSKNKEEDNEVLSLNLEVEKFTLENGLRVLLLKNGVQPIFSYYTFFDVGGRYERAGTTGATHFLEHLMFKGTKKFGPGSFDSIIEKNGGSTNAYTTFDSTVYYESLPINSLEKIIDLESDRMSELLIDPKTFESERLVVLEERKGSYENRPGGKLYQKMMRTVFNGTPYGGSVIGDEKDVLNLKINEVHSFFKRFYAPNNAILVIVGDIDVSKAKELVKQYYGPIAKVEQLDSIKSDLDKVDAYKNASLRNQDIMIHGNSPTPMFSLAFKGEPLGSKNSFVLDILSSIMGDGESSYLNQLFVYGNRPYLSNIGVSNYTLKKSGVFYISGQLLNSKNMTYIKNKLRKNLKGYCKEAINDRSLQKTKNQYLISYYRELETNAGLAHFLGLRESFFDDYSYYKKELEIYNSITKEEVLSSCLGMFDKNSVFVSIWDKNPKSK